MPMNRKDQTVPFQQVVETLLDRAVASGLQLPIVFVMVSVNGYVSAVRYSRAANGEWDRTLLVQGTEPPNVFPVNVCFFDATGSLLSAKLDSPSDYPTGSVISAVFPEILFRKEYEET